MSAEEKTDNQAKTQAKFNFVVSGFNLVISFSISIKITKSFLVSRDKMMRAEG